MLGDFWKFLKESGNCWKLAILVLFYIVSELVPTWFLGNVPDTMNNMESNPNKSDGFGTEFYIKGYCISVFVSAVYISYFDVSVQVIANDIMEKFIDSYYRKYTKLEHKIKTQKTGNLQKNIDSAKWSLCGIIDWGIPTAVDLTSSILTTIWIFWKKDMIDLLLLAILANALVYWFVVRHRQYEYTCKRNELRVLSDRADSREIAQIFRVENGTLDVGEVINSSIEKTRKDTYVVKLWKIISIITDVTNKIPYIAYILMGNTHSPVKFLLFVRIFGNFTSSLNSIMQFLNCYQNNSMKYDKCADMFKSLENWEKKEEIIKVLENYPDSVPEKIDIVNVDIEFGSKRIISNPKTKMNIKEGDNIRLLGPSGCGKTTFINALFGRREGVKIVRKNSGDLFNSFNSFNFENLKERIVEFRQDVKEKTPTNCISVRDLFNGEPDDEVIMHYMRYVGLEDWVNNLEKSEEIEVPRVKTFLELSKDYLPNYILDILRISEDFGDLHEPHDSHELYELTQVCVDTMCNSDNNNKLDFDIGGSLSGGEKSRLILATVLFSRDKQNAQIMVLDECCTGVDPPQKYEIYDKIMKDYSGEKGVTIIWVTHAENAGGFNKIWKIDNGMITQYA